MTSSYSERLNLLIIFVVIISYVSVESCYITDCPNSVFWNSGKREPTRDKQTRSGPPIRKCPPCGLRGTGQCFSSRMCCTPALGCVIGENEITEPCRYESRIPVECASAGPTCMRKDREKGNVQSMGVCAADGLCCNADGCTYHHECALSEKKPSETMTPASDSMFEALIGGLMKKLHEAPGYPDYSDDRDAIPVLREYRRSHPRREAMLMDESGMY